MAESLVCGSATHFKHSSARFAHPNAFTNLEAEGLQTTAYRIALKMYGPILNLNLIINYDYDVLQFVFLIKLKM